MSEEFSNSKNSDSGCCFSICLIFCQFQPGVAYKSVAYKKTCISLALNIHRWCYRWSAWIKYVIQKIQRCRKLTNIWSNITYNAPFPSTNPCWKNSHRFGSSGPTQTPDLLIQITPFPRICFLHKSWEFKKWLPNSI